MLLKKIKKLVSDYNYYNNFYQIPKNSAAICFYILISLISILTLTFQIITLSGNVLETFLLPKLIDIFSENFSETLMAALPNYSLSGFSIVVLFSFFWGASRTINAYNRIADFIYLKVKNRSGFKNRISAFLMFMMLLIVILFELSLLVFSNSLIRKYIPPSYTLLVRLLQATLEVLLIFTTLLILFLYAPPVNMRIRDAYKGAVFSTLFIYLSLGIFVIIINLMNRFAYGYTIITITSYSFLLLYYINHIIISGFILNYYGNFFQLKKALFRKE